MTTLAAGAHADGWRLTARGGTIDDITAGEATRRAGAGALREEER